MLSVEYSNLEKAQWVYLVATLIVAEKLLLFWLSGLIGLFGGKLYGDKLPRLQDGEWQHCREVNNLCNSIT